jgi:succinyl-diaminopimelate desuccinylase
MADDRTRQYPVAVERRLADRDGALRERAHALIAEDTRPDAPAPIGLLEELAAELSAAGLTASILADAPSTPVLVAERPGASDCTLCLNGHLDTVAFDREQWSHDPLGEWDGDRLYGRGATDMKGPVAAMVEAMLAHAATDTDPPIGLQLALVGAEETGGDGLESLLASTDRRPDAVVIGETTQRGDRMSVAVADRGAIWLTLEAAGEAAHGSRPVFGRNAIDRLYGAIEALRTQVGELELSLPADLAPIVAETATFYEGLDDAEVRELFDTPTINLGTIEGGTEINTVPERATAAVDVRIAAGVDAEAVLERIRGVLDDRPGVAIADVDVSQGSYHPIDQPLASAAVRATLPDVEGDLHRRSATGGGDAKTARHAGVPAVELAFGTDTAHAVDEYTTADALAANARTYAALPWAYAAAVGPSADG